MKLPCSGAAQTSGVPLGMRALLGCGDVHIADQWGTPIVLVSGYIAAGVPHPHPGPESLKILVLAGPQGPRICI